ncbi:MAG TPA: transposase [Candidatus Acidoferrales bacterium]|nr:transposase [Candidatus Acidoferrales bacterium]
MNQSSARPERRSIRMKGFDYSLPGAYFVTICAHRQKCLFGDVVLGEMKLNQIGVVVNECWLDIPRHFPNVELNAHVVMPNHLHELVAIHETIRAKQGAAPEARAQHAAPLPRQVLVAGSLPAIIRSFKAASTKCVREVLREAAFDLWQRNYYDGVLRNARELKNARRYIAENPSRWHRDKENPRCEDWLLG